MLHLGNLFSGSHLAHQVVGPGLGILPPILVHIQAAVAVQIDELVAIHLNDGLHMGVQQGLLVGLSLRKGSSGQQASRHGGRTQYCKTALEGFVNQQGSNLLSHWLLSAR